MVRNQPDSHQNPEHICSTDKWVYSAGSTDCREGASGYGRCLSAFRIWVAQSDPDALRTAAGAQQATVRACARRVLSAIGADTLPQDQNAAPSSPPTAAAASEPQPDLLGGLVDEAAPSPPQAAPDTLLADAAAADVMYQQPEQQVVHAASEQHLGAPLPTFCSSCRLPSREGTTQHFHSTLDMNMWQCCPLDVSC